MSCFGCFGSENLRFIPFSPTSKSERIYSGIIASSLKTSVEKTSNKQMVLVFYLYSKSVKSWVFHKNIEPRSQSQYPISIYIQLILSSSIEFPSCVCLPRLPNLACLEVFFVGAPRSIFTADWLFYSPRLEPLQRLNGVCRNLPKL